MSGPFGSSQWMYSSGAAFYPFAIDQSLRFNDNDSAYLSRTPASAGNRKTWTWSGWVKISVSGSTVTLFSSGTGSVPTTRDFLSIDNDGYIKARFVASSTNFQSSSQLRDPSAWYHIVLAVDTTQATSSDRTKIYVNGDQITSFVQETYPSQNADTMFNSVNSHTIGRFVTGGEYLDGYLAEVNFVDGQALDPTSFGEFKSGVWIPKQYGGTYGTNGFRLSFADSSNIGDDTSGNTNDWTANSLVATDVLLDSPTNNFAVLNPTDVYAADLPAFQEGNLKFTIQQVGQVKSTFAVSSGKWYWEVLNSSDLNMGGLVKSSVAQNNTYGGQMDARISYGSAAAANDIIRFRADIDNGTFEYAVNNGSFTTTGISGSITAGEEYKICFSRWDVEQGTDVANFGQDSSFAGNKTAQGNTDANGIGDFYYAPPSGYLALCTANLPDPVIDPAQDDVPADYFNTVLYTGTGTTDQSVTGVGFQPDFTWIKSRSNATAHWLSDAVRGAGKGLRSDATDAEYTTLPIFLSFDTDGFTVDVDDATANNTTNGSGYTYAAWNWLAGNGTSSNTDGSITSTVSVNQKAGFSIVGWTGNGSSAQTVGHGLNATPSVILAKTRSDADSWVVYHSSVVTTDTQTLYLNLTNGLSTVGTSVWDISGFSSTTFGIGANDSINENTDNFIAYCFAEVEGYSKFGKYTGNGSTDGPFVFCNFRPALVCVKRTSDVGSWTLLDAERSPYNDVDDFLYANLSNAELADTTADVDFLSNGFKIRNTSTDQNASGSTYIYMAFAANPFKYANAR